VPAAAPIPADQDAVWFYATGGAATGPVSLGALHQAIRRGGVGPATPVWRDGMPAWAAAGAVPECRPAFTAAPPVMPGPLHPPPGATPTHDAATRMLLPVGRSPYAIIAGYLGLFSVLLVPAPLAVVFALLAIRDMQRHPELSGMGRAVFGLVMGGLGSIGLSFMIVSLASGR
jgi:hypothetical protein